MTDNIVPADGGGPGGHPGVTIIELVNDPDVNKAAIEIVLEAGGEALFSYTVAGGTFAVFASGYKK